MDSHDRSVAGFTLIEILVVLAILGVLSAVVLPKLRLSEGARLRSTTHALVVNLRLSRNEAIRRGETTQIVPIEGGYRLEPSGRRQALPSGIILTAEPANAALLPDQGEGVRFFSDGSSTGGVLAVRQGDLAIRVAIRGMDGKAQLHEQ